MTSGTQAAPAPERHQRQELVGKVTSAKMQKTIVVKVTRLVQHPLVHARGAHLQEVLRA